MILIKKTTFLLFILLVLFVSNNDVYGYGGSYSSASLKCIVSSEVVNVGTPVIFSAKGSISNYFSSDSISITWSGDITGSGDTVTHIFDTPGNYYVVVNSENKYSSSSYRCNKIVVLEADEEVPVGTPHKFLIDLPKYIEHGDVYFLQLYLNNNGYVIASEGPGSPGNETDYFGDATVEALKRWQADQGITITNDDGTVIPADGTFLGPTSRAILNGESLLEDELTEIVELVPEDNQEAIATIKERIISLILQLVALLKAMINAQS